MGTGWTARCPLCSGTRLPPGSTIETMTPCSCRVIVSFSGLIERTLLVGGDYKISFAMDSFANSFGTTGIAFPGGISRSGKRQCAMILPKRARDELGWFTELKVHPPARRRTVHLRAVPERLPPIPRAAVQPDRAPQGRERGRDRPPSVARHVARRVGRVLRPIARIGYG